MSKLRVKIDRDLCQGHSVCLAECPEVFQVLDNDQAPYPQVELITSEPAEELREKVMRAAAFCPNGVITVEDIDN